MRKLAAKTLIAIVIEYCYFALTKPDQLKASPSLKSPSDSGGLLLFNTRSATQKFAGSSIYSIANCILSQHYPIMETTPIPNELQIDFFYLKKAALTFRAVNNKI